MTYQVRTLMKLEPRYYQAEAVEAIFDYFDSEEGAGNPLVELPTASGKSLVQVMIGAKVLNEFPDCRILFLTHQQELIKQNYNEMILNLGIVDAGIYSSGLNCRDTENKIIFAGIQSVYKRALELGCFNLIVVDECHLVSKKGMGMYRAFLDAMLNQAPYCKIIGLTATPYRLDSGLLTEGEGKIFDEIIYRASLAKLVKEGFLCELIGKQGIVRPDTSGVHKRGGDFIESELNKVCDDAVIIQKAVSEIVDLSRDRNHILVFCTGIEHAEHVKAEFEMNFQSCEVIHSKLSVQERDRITSGFKNGDIRIVCNVDMWTTGFNARHIDCIVLLRPTMSTGLYYQMCGRGLRTHENKKNCLILDYGGNILLHGPLDKIEVETKELSSSRGVRTAPMKECPECKTPNFIQTLKCTECGYEWPVNIGHDAMAGDGEPLSKYKPPVEIVLEKSDTSYYAHESKSGQMCMRVSYSLGVFDHVDDYICIEHGGYAEAKARQWLKTALPAGYPVPDTVEDCMELADVYKRPTSIYVDYNQKFPRIISRTYEEIEEQEEQIENHTSMDKISRRFIR